MSEAITAPLVGETVSVASEFETLVTLPEPVPHGAPAPPTVPSGPITAHCVPPLVRFVSLRPPDVVSPVILVAPAIAAAPPTLTAPPMPTPPVTINAPVTVDDDAVELLIV